MKRTEFAAIQPAIDRHGLNRSIEIAEALADIIFAVIRGTQRLANRAGGKMEEIAPYLPRSPWLSAKPRRASLPREWM